MENRISVNLLILKRDFLSIEPLHLIQVVMSMIIHYIEQFGNMV